MSLKKALEILNLNGNYTEEDLKRAYRRLIRNYHPDKHQGNDKIIAEEKTKEINEAKDVLERNLKDKNRNSKDTIDEIYRKEMDLLHKLKIRYKQEIKEEIDYIRSIDSRDKIFAKWKERFEEIVINFYNCIDLQPSTISIKLNYDSYRKEYFKLVCYYLYDNWEASKVIDFVSGNLKINNTDNLKNVRKKMSITINTILNKELEEFKTFDNYEKAKPLLLGVRDGYATLCLWGYLNIETARKDFKDKALGELIKYNKRVQKIDELINYEGFPTPLAVELYNNILNEEKFENIYNKHITTQKKMKIKIKKIFSK